MPRIGEVGRWRQRGIISSHAPWYPITLATRPTVGFLASVRGVELQVDRLDTIETPLSVVAERLSGNDTTILYRFEVSADGRRLLHGRAAVIMTPDTLAPKAPA